MDKALKSSAPPYLITRDMKMGTIINEQNTALSEVMTGLIVVIVEMFTYQSTQFQFSA
jgi:hypothetical protein